MINYNIIPQSSIYDKIDLIFNQTASNTIDFSINFISYLGDKTSEIIYNYRPLITGCFQSK